ncbi:MAG: CRISPR-associated helicase Cas3' [Firmicutes bacterium]|nr:CRISPR-associated helicase Cas3' [Bacillota bacterium]
MYAHSRPGQPEDTWQTLREHLTNTAALAGEFAAAFGAEAFGLAAGILHDLGKYAAAFQERLRGAGFRVDHSTAGAREAERIYGGAVGRILAYVVAGHHAGLPDWGSAGDAASLAARLASPLVEPYEAYKEDDLFFPPRERLRLPFPLEKLRREEIGFSLQFFIRMLYSCLADADFLDTERFMDEKKSKTREKSWEIPALSRRLDEYLDRKCATAERTYINAKRAEILAACRKKAASPPGFYTLTVPTGGGKTLSSLSFALRHAVEHGLRRVIYVIPFTSIIEQNARVFREVLGEECVLEHHSNVQHPEIDDDDEMNSLRLAEENWDMPLVVTTNVQFFESLFAARSSRCRKLHNIANSVIILDEAQMLPAPYLKPCLAALVELVRHYRCTVVLCTATQPALNDLLPEDFRPAEIAPDPQGLYESFRRVVTHHLGEVDDDSIIDELSTRPQALCIVNTRRHARRLFELLPKEEGGYHLSALMCPAHRSQILQVIRERLAKKQQCLVISTQLVEAGVDVDFPVVYRAAAGVDSIAQAAGRCNREGRLDRGEVYIFQPEKHGRAGGWLDRTAAVAEMVRRNHADLLSPAAVEDYFTRLFALEGEGLDRYGILKRLAAETENLAFPFREIAGEFRIIDTVMYPVVVPYDKRCEALLAEVEKSPFPGRYFRQLQPYTVQLYPQEIEKLQKDGALRLVAEQYLVLADYSRYDDRTGLVVDLEGGGDREVLIL